jgi:hypothetical protein
LRGPLPPPTTTNMGGGPQTMPLKLERGRAHLDVTSDRRRLYLGTHVSNSVGQTGTVLLDPCATPNKGIGWPYHMIGRDGAARSSSGAYL